MSGPNSLLGASPEEPLSIRDGRLFFDELEVTEIARRFGTPAYVISETALRAKVRRFQEAFQSRWPEGTVRLLPSFKANLSLALRHVLNDEGTGCDAFGAGELHAARITGVRPELVSVNGPCKDSTLLRDAIEFGARVTLDSADEIFRVREVARAVGRRARIRFRLRPDYTELDEPSDFAEGATVRDAARAYKPGIPTEQLLDAGGAALGWPEVEVSGVMVHLGRHSADLNVWREMVRSTVATIARLSSAWGGWEPAEIDLGGGFATPRDPTARIGRTEAISTRRERAPSIEEYAEAITGTLRHELRAHALAPEGKAVEFEPGRSLYADVGIHLTTVRNIKHERTPSPHAWVETDTTEMFLLDGIIERNRWNVLIANRPDAPTNTRADLVGTSCGFDVIVADVDLPNPTIGDVAVFLDTGAYQDACANNFNALSRPPTVLVRGREAELIKARETVEDVFRRDLVPTRLRGRTP